MRYSSSGVNSIDLVDMDYDKFLCSICYTKHGRINSNKIKRINNIYNNLSNIRNYLLNRYDDIFIDYSSTIIRIKSNINEYKCKTCGRQLTKKIHNGKIQLFCCKKCMASNVETKDKKASTCRERYGYEFWHLNPINKNQISESIKRSIKENDSIEKRKQTCREKYGKDYWQQSKTGKQTLSDIAKSNETQTKVKETCLSKYGVEHWSKSSTGKKTLSNIIKSKDVQEKTSKTNLKLYGSKTWSSSSTGKAFLRIKNSSLEVRDKTTNTCLEKYGVEHWSKSITGKQALSDIVKSNETQYKIKSTNIERYGVEHWSKSDIGKQMLSSLLSSKNIRDKINKTNLERYGYENVLSVPEIRARIVQTNINRYGSSFATANETYRHNMSKLMSSPEMIKRRFDAMKTHGTFNVSKEENECYEIIKSKFPLVVRQYHSILYPYNCDFYIPEIDTYIEYNGFMTHGQHPFDPENPDDIKTLNEWKEKSICHPLYLNAINDWTKRDVKKRNTAKENNLSFLEFYNIENLKNYIDSL